MMKVLNTMRTSARKTDIEIINYNYARIFFDENEKDLKDDGGKKIIDEINDRINSKTTEYKKNYDTVLSSKVTGRESVILISGIGDLAKNHPESFKMLLKLKTKVINEQSNEDEPLMQRVSSKAPTPENKPTSKSKSKPAAKKVEKKKVEKKKKSKSSSESLGNDQIDYLYAELRKNENVLDIDSASETMAEKFGMDKDDAKSRLTSLSDERTELDLNGELLWLDGD